jgi:hypothetical protein
MQMVNTNQLNTEEGKVFVSKVLREGVAQITFTKVDGTERLMKCTLSEKVVPKATEEKTSTKTPNPNIISVWDVEKEGWRSFRWDSIKAFSFDV